MFTLALLSDTALVSKLSMTNCTAGQHLCSALELMAHVLMHHAMSTARAQDQHY